MPVIQPQKIVGTYMKDLSQPYKHIRRRTAGLQFIERNNRFCNSELSGKLLLRQACLLSERL